MRSLRKGLRIQAGLLPGESVAGSEQSRRGVLRDEQVGVESSRPVRGPVVQPGRKTHFDWFSERSGAALGQSGVAVDDVGEPERAGLPVSEGVEHDDRDAERCLRVEMDQRGADRSRVERASGLSAGRSPSVGLSSGR